MHLQTARSRSGRDFRDDEITSEIDLSSVRQRQRMQSSQKYCSCSAAAAASESIFDKNFQHKFPLE
jgi:hypothetical protein